MLPLGPSDTLAGSVWFQVVPAHEDCIQSLFRKVPFPLKFEGFGRQPIVTVEHVGLGVGMRRGETQAMTGWRDFAKLVL